MPIWAHKNEEIWEIYEQISEVIVWQKKKTNLIILGVWITIAWEAGEHWVTGTFGLGKRNRKQSRLFEFSKEKDLNIMNTMFK